MYINSLNNFSKSQNRQNTLKRPSFKSVIPCKVFINGEISKSKKINKKVIRILSKILTDPLGTIEEELVKLRFFQDRDFRWKPDGNENGKKVRCWIGKETSFLFTGKNAEELDELGKEIGPAKHDAIKATGTAKSKDVDNKTKAYFKKKMSLITSNEQDRIKEKTNPVTKEYEGKLLGLHVDTFTDTSGEIHINDVHFRKIKEDKYPLPPEAVKQEYFVFN